MKTSKINSFFRNGNFFLRNNTNKSLFNFMNIGKKNFITNNSLNYKKNITNFGSNSSNFLNLNSTKNNFLIKNLEKKNFCQTAEVQKFSIELLLPNFDRFSMDFDETSTFKDVANSIQKNFKFENIEFRTWDHSNIALGNDLSSTLTSRKFVFLRIDTFEWQLINYSNMKNNFNEAFDDCNLK